MPSPEAIVAALSLQLAVQAGYWDPHVISEDYHMYLKCFFATGAVFVFLCVSHFS